MRRRQMRSVSLKMEDAMEHKLRLLAAEMETSRSQFIRLAIEEKIEQSNKKAAGTLLEEIAGPTSTTSTQDDDNTVKECSTNG
jgi:predicted transcriptional regulator